MNRCGVILGAVVIGLSAIGCGGSEKAKPATEAASQGGGTAATDPARAAGQMAEQLQKLAQGQPPGQAPVTLVNSDELKAMLPEISGWQRSNTKSEQVSMGVASFSHALTHYASGETSVDLEITDTAMSQMMLAPVSAFLANGFSQKSDEGYKRATSVAGSPGFEEWNKGTRQGELTAVVANRFIVHGAGHGVDSVEPVRKVVEAVGLSKLAAIR